MESHTIKSNYPPKAAIAAKFNDWSMLPSYPKRPWIPDNWPPYYALVSSVSNLSEDYSSRCICSYSLICICKRSSYYWVLSFCYFSSFNCESPLSTSILLISDLYCTIFCWLS